MQQNIMVLRSTPMPDTDIGAGAVLRQYRAIFVLRGISGGAHRNECIWFVEIVLIE